MYLDECNKKFLAYMDIVLNFKNKTKSLLRSSESQLYVFPVGKWL